MKLSSHMFQYIENTLCPTSIISFSATRKQPINFQRIYFIIASVNLGMLNFFTEYQNSFGSSFFIFAEQYSHLFNKLTDKMQFFHLIKYRGLKIIYKKSSYLTAYGSNFCVFVFHFLFSKRQYFVTVCNQQSQANGRRKNYNNSIHE